MITRLAIVVMAIAVASSAFAQPRGEWIADRGTGCKVWSPNPLPGESVSWSGECRDGLATGRGVLQWLQAERPLSRTECEMSEGKITGRTVVHYTNGNRYEGEVRDNRYSGQGSVQYANGMRYDGAFREGLPNGPGTFTGNGETIAGTWTKGCLSQGDIQIWVVTTKEACGFK